jgi:eukaryotic-like serine/threonine-protein kinase
MPMVTPLRPDDPRRVGRYRLAGCLADLPGSAAPGHTFLGRLPDGSQVAVTLPGRTWAPDAASRDRFSAEARAARRVAPFCTARIVDAGLDADQPYLISEFVEGPSLAEVVRDEGPLDGAALTAVAIGAATGLASIHQAGLVHGNFGPGDLVLGPDGPRVVNFSITPPYGAATPAADLLAWARTVMFAAGADGPADLPDGLPEPLRAVVPACLAADPPGRPAARAVLTALLGQSDPPAGLLAEGARRARAAAREITSAAAVADEVPATSAARRVAWAAGFTACLAAIAVAGALIATQRGHHDQGRPADLGHSATAARRPSPSARPSPTVPASLAGSWAGTVQQTDPSLSVTVQIELAAGSSAGTISYPQLGCSGHLLLVSATGRVLTLEQGITSGQRSCNDGVVTLTGQSASALHFTFRRTGAPSPSGTLTRTAPPPSPTPTPSPSPSAS